MTGVSKGSIGSSRPGPARPEQLDEHRYHRDEDDQQQDRFDVVLDEVDLAEEVAERSDSHAPEQSSDDVVGDEGAVVHLRRARHDRDEGPDDRDEPGEHHRLRAVLLEELRRPVHVFATEEPAVGAVEQGRAELPADRVADLVTGDRGDRDRHQQDPDVGQRPVGGEQARGEEQRVAGQEEADQQARLDEDDREDAERAEGLDQLLRLEPARPEGQGERGGDLVEQIHPAMVRIAPGRRRFEHGTGGSRATRGASSAGSG